jgi:hypothetical protein
MILQKIQEQKIAAMKSHDEQTVTSLGYILSQIKNKEIEKKALLTDEEVTAILRKVAKELQESLDAFQKGGREDLVAKTKTELKLISSYLPAEISDEELKKEIEKILAEKKDLQEKNPKAMIGICIRVLKAKANPSRIVKTLQSL